MALSFEFEKLLIAKERLENELLEKDESIA
jgi:hypothetical protein